MQIDYESEAFPIPGPVGNGLRSLPVTWNDLLWAAITVGRPNRFYVIRHGVSSFYEMLFRASALRLSVEQQSPHGTRLYRTPAARSLDPSEKGALNYFLGLTMCKLFTEKRLGAPWVVHLDVFRTVLGPTFLRGRSRPDLVGLTTSNQWVAMESKGRVSSPSADDRKKAKKQARRILTVAGSSVQWRIAGFSYFRKEVLRFYWRDPKPVSDDSKDGVHLKIQTEDFWRGYYEPILRFIGPERAREMVARTGGTFRVEEADFALRIAVPVLKLLVQERWQEAGRWCLERRDELTEAEVKQDGIAVDAGTSWSERLNPNELK